MSFTENLNTELKARGWKPVNLAAALSDRGVDVSMAAVNQWVKGISEPRVGTARMVADIFGIPFDVLVPLPTTEPAHDESLSGASA